MNSVTKVCRRCKIEKSLDEFGNYKRQSDGRAIYCRACWREYRRNWYYQRRQEKFGKSFDENITKACIICGKTYPATPDYFHRNAITQDGLSSKCRWCVNVKGRQYTAAYHKSGVAQRRLKEWREKNWEAELVYQARSRSKKSPSLGTPDIDTHYVRQLYDEQNGKCYWFGVDLVPNGPRKDPQTPSLDRLDMQRGYVKGNVVLTCLAANYGRNDTATDRFQKFCDLLLRHKDAPSR